MKKSLFTLVILVVMGVAVQADITTQPYIAGEFNGWAPGDIPMNSLGDGIWEYTITGLTEGAFHGFKVTEGTWTVAYPTSGNAWYDGPASGEVTVTFNTNTVSDGWLPAQYRIGVSVDPGAWTLVGNFASDSDLLSVGEGGEAFFWNNAAEEMAMTSLGKGVYVITKTFEPGDYELKPTRTASWDAIGTDGRSVNASNYELSLETTTEVTVYVDAYRGVFGIEDDDLDLSYLGFAYAPNPSDGDVVGSGLSDLSWSNPDPNNPADTITCDVYFLDGGTSLLSSDPNMGPDITDPGVVLIADDLTADTLDLNDALVTVLPLQEDHYYYWAVHATDPHADPNGNPVTTPGNTWYFFTGDAAPVPGQPVDQYMWLGQDDSAVPGGDGPSNVRYFQVTATYEDDDRSEVVDANFVNLNWDWAKGELGIVEVSDVHYPETKTVTAVYRTIYAEDGDPNNTTTLPGYWQIALEVTDGTGTVRGTPGIHRVFETCGEAADADPEDTYDGYYDTNNDCIVSLPDFADFAEAWLSKGDKYE